MDQLRTAVESAREALQSGRDMSERQLEHVIVLPIVRALGWDTNLREAVPDYATGNGRVDWALCSRDKAYVFLEEKAPDADLNKHEEQLLKYVFSQGVPLAVLTNGREWRLYLGVGEMPWAERRFATVDLWTHDVGDAIDRLAKYLSKDRVVSGEARAEAEEAHRRNREEARLKARLPGLLRALLTQPTDELVKLLQREIQSQLDALPPPTLIRQIIRALLSPEACRLEEHKAAANRPVASAAVQGSVPPPYSKPVAVLLKGKRVPVRHWKDMLVETANWILSEGRTLPVGQVPGSKWVLVSASPKGMRAPYKLSNGCFIETWFSARDCVSRSKWLMSQAGYSEDDVLAEYVQPQ